MKLLKKTNLYYLYFSIVVFIVTSIILFFILNYIVEDEVDEMLTTFSEQVIQQLDSGKEVSNIKPILEISKNDTIPTDYRTSRNVMIFDSIQNELEPYRELILVKNINATNYKISVRHSIIESSDYMVAIGLSILQVFLLMMIGLNFLNLFISKKIWSAFNINLNVLKKYSIKKEMSISLKKSDIQEFRELNEVIYSLTDQIKKDYNSLKEFTENASHEMQTPLAVIQSKIEILIQGNDVSSNQANIIASISKAITKLSKLNQNLLLLAKIDNDQFLLNEKINCSQAVSDQLLFYSDFAEFNNKVLTSKINSDVALLGNKVLIDILYSNLVSNAIKHSTNIQPIRVELTSSSFTIQNSGNDPGVEPEMLFNRFTKRSQTNDSTGLGLSIVKKICEVHDWKINYTFSADTHKLTVVFK
tara:strand:+ start:1957 stop:3207 length:1251 start_codon:yes stop_codon:yes gene_type:complete